MIWGFIVVIPFSCLIFFPSAAKYKTKGSISWPGFLESDFHSMQIGTCAFRFAVSSISTLQYPEALHIPHKQL